MAEIPKSKKPVKHRKYTDSVQADLISKIEAYIQKTSIPILKEFCWQNNINSKQVYELEFLSDSIKKLIDKKEAQLERLALNKEIEKTMAIFSLKQLGWKDSVEHNIHSTETVDFNYTVVSNDDKNKS